VKKPLVADRLVCWPQALTVRGLTGLPGVFDGTSSVAPAARN
jgi:hypothetical protein